jgi:hypothetical protein
MFCSECGVKASGKFCWSCGKLLVQGSPPADTVVAEVPDAPLCDWTELTDCQSLIAVPEVRERIARHAAKAKKKFSGEDFLEACDKVLAPLSGGLPFTLIAKFAQPIAEKLGLKTGKGRSERMVERPGVAIVAILCSLAQNGQQIREATSATDGCTITASIPSDIWSLKGDLVVRVEGNITVVEAGLTIPGQLYDWGKCNRALDRLFDEINTLAQAA